MTTRLDLVLQKHPDHEDGIRLLASRDPSGNLKYLDWGAKILSSKQALAPEVADVLELFHQFGGRGELYRNRRIAIRSDIYSHRPKDFAVLRDSLLKLKRAQDRKRKKRERLYRIEGTVDVDVVYDSPDLIVRHIKNKPASVHYGLNTKWCISMLRDGYFEDYEANNATFFFFERKTPNDDEFDKVALMMSRGSSDETTAFTSTDRRVDMMLLAKVHGPRVFDIFREVYERSERYPGSAIFRIYDGSATQEQLEATFTSVASGELKLNSSYDVDALMESICCNDAAPLSLLTEVAKRAPVLSALAWKRSVQQAVRRGRRRRTYRRGQHSTKELVIVLAAALMLHPATPMDARSRLAKELRKRHVKIGDVHRTKFDGRVGVSYRAPSIRGKSVRLRRRAIRRTRTLTGLQAQVGVLERRIVKTKKAIDKKLAEKAKKEKA